MISLYCLSSLSIKTFVYLYVFFVLGFISFMILVVYIYWYYIYKCNVDMPSITFVDCNFIQQCNCMHVHSPKAYSCTGWWYIQLVTSTLNCNVCNEGYAWPSRFVTFLSWNIYRTTTIFSVKDESHLTILCKRCTLTRLNYLLANSPGVGTLQLKWERSQGNFKIHLNISVASHAITQCSRMMYSLGESSYFEINNVVSCA